jgi:hypothetical protein
VSERRWEVIHGDSLAVLRSFPGDHFDAVVQDPPAGIGFMGKDFDRDRGGRQQWVAWLAEIMAEALRVTKPGGLAFTWALPRTSHWTATAIEDGGWKIADIVVHLFGSGFPKSRSLLKPAAEHWILARKPGPLRELGIDQCRVGTGGEERAAHHGTGRGVAMVGNAAENWSQPYQPGDAGKHTTTAGRWPSNVVLSHCEPNADGEGGCRLVGTRRVRGSNKPGPGVYDQPKAHGWGHADHPTFDYADPDGFETVEHWICDQDRCPVALLDRQAGESISTDRAAYVGRQYGTGDGSTYLARKPQGAGYSDAGSKSRFFPTFAPDADEGEATRMAKCWLCDGTTHGIMSVSHSLVEEGPCAPVSSAEPSSNPDAPRADSAPAPVQPRPLPGFEAWKESDSIPAADVASSLRNTPAITEPTALPSAATPTDRLLAQRVRSAGSLCDSCATAIAQSLARARLKTSPPSLHGLASISEPKRQILTRSLAHYAAALGDTDTIPTTASLSLWFGSVRAAMPPSTPIGARATASDPGPTRFLYQSKSSRAEREAGLEGLALYGVADADTRLALRYHEKAQGPLPQQTPSVARDQANHHPTVKPLALMRWLCRLVTPPVNADGQPGLILDPFAGSGTTGCAAVLEGFRFVGIEREAEYCEIARRRIAHWSGDSLPLFRGMAD